MFVDTKASVKCLFSVQIIPPFVKTMITYEDAWPQ